MAILSKSWLRELPVFTTKAHVFQIDPDTKKKWLPLSVTAVTVAYYHDTARHIYRIISVDGTKVLINSTVTANMTFTKTSQKFGQWSDIKANTVYGLGFSSEDELLKFMEKFDEVKSLSAQSTPPEKSKSFESAPNLRPPNHSPQLSDSSGEKKKDDLDDRLEQLQYENDRLKVALTQSSANAKKWDTELQTLRSNNARLSAALQESAANVEQWKKQLHTYQEENTYLKQQLSSAHVPDGAEFLQRHLDESLDKLKTAENEVVEKQKELDELRVLVEQLKPLKMQNQRLEARAQVLDEENSRMQRELVQVSAVQQKEDRLKALQQQFSAKINELYVMNDSLAELLQSSK